MSVREQIEPVYAKLEAMKGDDRLAYLTRIIYSRNMVVNTLETLKTLSNLELSLLFKKEELKEISTRMDGVTESMINLLEWFISHAEKEEIRIEVEQPTLAV